MISLSTQKLLDDLYEHKVSSASWCIDEYANIIQVNLIDGSTSRVTNLADVSSEVRERFLGHLRRSIEGVAVAG